jgi:thymidylate synthase (FAD)
MHSAKLIAISKPIGEEMNGLTPEECIIYMARVSSPNSQGKLDTSIKLLRYLLDHGHYSPFQMVSATFEVTTTRAISRQLLRHRSLNFQEYSGRYAEMPYEMIEQECRLQDKKNRQSSIKTYDLEYCSDWEDMQDDVWNKAIESYQEAIKRGIAKEVARSLLPEGLTESRLYVHGTIRDIMFYLKQRIGNGTQKEHELLARSIASQLNPLFPNTLEALGIC